MCECGGVKDREAHVNIYIGPRAQSKEEPLLDHGCSRGQREQPTTGSDTPGHSMD